MIFCLRVALLLVLAAMLLSLATGCSSLPAPPPPVTTAEVPVATPCPALADVPPIPATIPDRELKGMNHGKFVIALGADRAALLAWTRTADAAIRACAK